MELEEGEESLGDDILKLSTADIQARQRLLDNEVGADTNSLVLELFLSGTKYQIYFQRFLVT